MSYASLHHVAINTTDFDWYVRFFEEVMEMSIRRTKGEAPKRQLWFHEGIQLKEVPLDGDNGTNVDHVALGVADIHETVDRALAGGCTAWEKGDNWFVLPNGIRIELMEM